MRANNAPLELEDIRIDDPAPGEVLVKVAASGICHSDLTVLEGGLPVPPPCVLGHEPAGVVEAVGAGVADFAPGDHVIGCLTSWCGVCKFCTAGRPYLCPTQFAGRPPESKPRLSDEKGQPLFQFANLSSFAERMLCPERSLVKIRDDMPLDRASLIGCGVTTGLGAALNTVELPAGASVVIIGCGGVGLAALQGARIRGAGTIIAVDAKAWEFDLAQKLGANHCIDATDGDPVAAVQALTGGGADFVFECIGLVPTVQQAVAMTGRGVQEKKITGSFMGSNRFRFDMPKYVDFYLDGRLFLDEMISSRIGLDEVNDGLDLMRKGEAARQVIVFD
jgi:S-(hydroxymethyl)glutathione dehydrogenase/alcohol dehydrogenase